MILVDANVLLRLATRRDPQRGTARNALRVLHGRGEVLAFATQVIAEAWAVLTRPSNQRGGLGAGFARAKSLRQKVERGFFPLSDPADLYSRWTALIDAHQIVGVNAHEARLVAVMESNDVRDILTFNTKDFQRYPGITVIDPASV